MRKAMGSARVVPPIAAGGGTGGHTRTLKRAPPQTEPWTVSGLENGTSQRFFKARRPRQGRRVACNVKRTPRPMTRGKSMDLCALPVSGR